MTDEKTIGEELVEGLGKFASCQHELWSCCVCGCTTSTSGVVKLAGEDLAALRRDAARWRQSRIPTMPTSCFMLSDMDGCVTHALTTSTKSWQITTLVNRFETSLTAPK